MNCKLHTPYIEYYFCCELSEAIDNYDHLPSNEQKLEGEILTDDRTHTLLVKSAPCKP